MLDLDLHESLATFKAALASGDVSAVSSARTNLDLALLGSGILSPDAFSEIEQIITSDELIRFSAPYYFLNILSHNLDECFSQQQKERLAQLFQETYARLNEEAGCMLLVEMLTVLLREDEFIEFARSMTTKGEMQRAILGYGLGYFARKSNPSLQAISDATSILESLAKDTDADVRNEANDALTKLRRTSTPPKKKK